MPFFIRSRTALNLFWNDRSNMKLRKYITKNGTIWYKVGSIILIQLEGYIFGKFMEQPSRHVYYQSERESVLGCTKEDRDTAPLEYSNIPSKDRLDLISGIEATLSTINLNYSLNPAYPSLHCIETLNKLLRLLISE